MNLHGTMKINSRGHLSIGGCDCLDLAAEFGTPLYVMDEHEIRRCCRAYREAFSARYKDVDIAYASKAFISMAMCALIEEEGLSLDVSSGGELYTALKAGFPAEKIYFHGNNKTRSEIELGIKSNIGRFMVDNLYELKLINDTARHHQTKADVILRLTPGIDAHTHAYIQTGQQDSKFGFGIKDGQAIMATQQALAMDNICLKGFHCHIGSQIFEMESYKKAVQVMMEFMAEVRDKVGFEAAELDLGGGFGILYNSEDKPSTIDHYADTVASEIITQAEALGLSLPKLILEPGRSIVGEAGTTLYTIGSIKTIPGIRTYVAVDGGMADNPRVALYQAVYEAVIANKMNDKPEQKVSICGKCCESGDMLIWDITLPKPESGDILAVFCTGAYNYSMASNYNRLTRPAVVFVNEGQARLVVKRESFENLIINDVMPESIQKSKVRQIAF